MDCPIITVEDGTIVGGLASEVMERINMSGSKAQVYPIGVPDNFVAQGSVSELFELCGMDSNSIYKTIVRAKNEKQ